jgi:hypothetical protein
MSTTPAALKTTSPNNPATGAPFLRNMLMWMLSFLIIPIAGYIGTLLVGRVDNLVAALIGGAIVGLIVGAVQALVSRRRLPLLPWMIASTIGASVGVVAGTVAIGYQTSLGALALGGLITGVIVGIAQTLALPATTRLRWIWLPVTAALWPLAWTVTTLAGIKVEQQFIVFGATGAFVYTVLAGLVLQLLIPRPAAQTSTPATSTRR